MIPYSDSGSVGKASTVFLEDLIATILSITAAAWPNALASGEITTGSSEPDIAGSLGKAMIAEKKRRAGLDKQFRIEEEVGTRSSPTVIRADGRIDIKIIYSFDEDEYFGMECKKLKGSGKELAEKYVTDGMMRFVNGKYGRGHPWGAMLGFVLDGDADGSWKLICAQLKLLRKDTRMKGRWVVHRVWPSLPRLYRTHHYQYRQTAPMALLHLFLAFSPIASTASGSNEFSLTGRHQVKVVANP